MLAELRAGGKVQGRVLGGGGIVGCPDGSSAWVESELSQLLPSSPLNVESSDLRIRGIL